MKLETYLLTMINDKQKLMIIEDDTEIVLEVGKSNQLLEKLDDYDLKRQIVSICKSVNPIRVDID